MSRKTGKSLQPRVLVLPSGTMPSRDPNAPFELDSGDLEILMAGLRAPEGQPAAMRSRLREFQKRSFPKFANAGRGKRATYTIREVLQVALAFELVDVDLSSPRCINIVEQNRRTLDQVFIAAWASLRKVDEGAADRATLVEERRRLTAYVVLSAATHDGGAFVTFGGPPDNPPPKGWPGRRSRISIDLVALVADIVAALEGGKFRYLPTELDEAFLLFGKAVFRSDDPAKWVRGPLVPHDDRVLR